MSIKIAEALSLDSLKDRLFYEDDFEGDQIKDEWRVTGSGGGSVVVVDAQTGGIARISAPAGAANNNYRMDWNDIRSLLVTKQVTIEFHVKLTSEIDIEAWLGLWFDATHFIRFRFDDGAGNNWLIETDDGTGPTSADSGEVADTAWHIFRTEALPTGEVNFYIDGSLVANSPLITDIPTQHLQPYLYLETLINGAKTMDVGYIGIRQER